MCWLYSAAVTQNLSAFCSSLKAHAIWHVFVPSVCFCADTVIMFCQVGNNIPVFFIRCAFVLLSCLECVLL